MQQVFTPYLTVLLLSMEVIHGIMKFAYLYSDVSSMISRELEQLPFGTGKCVIEEGITYIFSSDSNID
jgi:hypothetical protein